jgi:hypothetical protein
MATTVNVIEVLHDGIDRATRDLIEARKTLRILQSPEFSDLIDTLRALPSFHEVERVQFFVFERDHINRTDIDLRLRPGLTEPQLVRDVVRAGLCSKLAKAIYWDQSSLKATGVLLDEDSPIGKVILEIIGYIPATCRIEYEEVEVPAHVERRARVVCTDVAIEVTP